jgi:transcriptional regulator with XRE-family HTH domain
MYNIYMRFNQLLTLFRERSGLKKKHLAEKLGIKPNYIGDIESGRKKAPTLERCKQIVKILKLNDDEATEFLNAAIEERTPKEIKDIRTSVPVVKEPRTSYTASPKVLRILSDPKVLEALDDPIAMKALLVTHKGSQDTKNAVQSLLECFPNLPPEKRQAILALCR